MRYRLTTDIVIDVLYCYFLQSHNLMVPVDLLHRGLQQDPRRPNNKEGGDSTLELGELEQLCVNNDSEISYDVSFKNFLPYFNRVTCSMTWVIIRQRS